MPRKKAAPKPLKKVSRKKTVVSAGSSTKTTGGAKVKKKVALKTKPAPPVKQKAPASKSAPTTPSPPLKHEPSLGRPLVTQEEKLYMLFHDDYQCRQVFEFLRVETVKELEEFSPQQIVHMMSRPIRLTVDRIRQRLAQFKRSLKDDEQFAAEFRGTPDHETGTRR
jgi:hypothetical protein